MKKIRINFLVCLLGAILLSGCASTGEGQAKEESISGVVVREDAGEKEAGKKEKKPDRKEKEDRKADGEESVLDGAEVFEDKEAEPAETESGSIGIVVGGIRIQIPREYGCFIEPDKGPIVYRDDLFVMLINVRDDSYEERMENPDSLMDGARKTGGRITKEIKEEQIGKRPYAWFTYSLNGNDFIVVYTPAADSGKRLCAQLLIEGEDVSEKELLERFASIAESAQETGEPDTTDEDMTELMRLANFGEKKTESTLKIEDTEITFQVEEGFYSQYQDTDEYWSCEYFAEPSDLNTVDCYLEPVDEEWDARAYIEDELQFAEEKGEVHKDTLEVDGNVFYYYTISYEYNGSHFQKMIAASDVKKGYIYVLKAGYVDVAYEMEPADFESFFHYEKR